MIEDLSGAVWYSYVHKNIEGSTVKLMTDSDSNLQTNISSSFGTDMNICL